MKFLLLFLSIFGFGDPEPEIIRKPGQITYSDEGGQLQCTSQIDSKGHIVALIENKKNNTSFSLLNVKPRKYTYVLKMLYNVKKYPNEFSEYVFMREIGLEINPIRVDKITLKGRPVFESKKIDVLTN